MAITTEDGTGLATAETYLSVTDALAYHSERGNTPWATITTAQQEQALRRATEYMLQVYRGRWKGIRMLSTQALDWPRSGVYLESPSGTDDLVADNIVPVEVERACAELAILAAAGPLLAPTTQGVVSESIGPISVTYDKAGSQAIKRPAIDAMLAPYFDRAVGTVKVMRA